MEMGNNVANHTIFSNTFMTNWLGFLYSNIGGAVISNYEGSVLNTPGSPRHNAGVAGNNGTTNVSTGFFGVSGTMTGSVVNGVTMTLSSPSTNLVTSTAGGAFSFQASNDTYSLTPYKLGYRFAPSQRTVVIFNGGSGANDFVSSDIYPILTFPDMKDQDLVVRDLTLNVTSDAPEILGNILYTISNLSPSNHYNSNVSSPYGTAVICDTTLQPDGPYLIMARAVDTVFARTATNAMTNIFITNCSRSSTKIWKISGPSPMTRSETLRRIRRWSSFSTSRTLRK